MLLDAIKALVPQRKEKDPVRENALKEIQKRVKPKRPRDNLSRSRALQAQNSVGQAVAGQLGGYEGEAAQRRRRSSPIAPLGGLGSLGV